MKDQSEIDKGFLKDRMKDFQVDPPESVWNQISARAGGRDRKGVLIIILAAAASVALAVTLGINYFTRDIPEMVQLSSEPASRITSPGQMDQADQIPVREDPAGTLSASNQETDPGRVEKATGISPDAMPLDQKPLDLEGPVGPGDARTKTAARESRDKAVENAVAEGETLEETAVPEGETLAVIAVPEGETLEETAVPEEETLAATGDPALEVEAIPESGSADPGTMVSLEPVPSRNPRWVLGAVLSPLYSFRDAASGAVTGDADHESGMLAYSAGMQVGYRPTGRLAVESGIYFNRTGIAIGADGIQLTRSEYDYSPMGVEAGSADVMAISNSMGNIVSFSGDIYVNSYKLNATYDANTVNNSFNSEVYADQGIEQHLDYLELPLNLRYTLVDRSIKLQLVGGVSTNLLVNNYITMDTPDGPAEIGYLTNIRTVNYTGNAGIGLAYHFLGHLSLSLEPRFRYFLNSINDESLPVTRPYSIGVYTGLSYFF